jgi:glycosyltransferase involved in cell wall biosynthesis
VDSLISARNQRVMIVHNHYRSASPSGENRVVIATGEALKEAGAAVLHFDRRSDEIEGMSPLSKASLVLDPIYSISSLRQFSIEVRDWRPNVMHVHNVYPLISPAVVRAAAAVNLPVVHFVHNYRHACLNGLLYRSGAACALCVEKGSFGPGIRFGCYRGSKLQSALLATSETVHRSTWEKVDRLVAVSRFVKDRLVEIGFDPDRIVVIPNLTRDPGPPIPVDRARFLFAGRLERAKGVEMLVDAWRDAHLPPPYSLAIAGSGDLEGLVRAAQKELPRVEYLGQLDRDALDLAIRTSAAVVVPSLVHETFGLTAIEAFSHGRAVVATSMGGLPEVVSGGVGWLAEPSIKDLARALIQAAGDEAELQRRGSFARARFEAQYSSQAVVARLLTLNAELIEA